MRVSSIAPPENLPLLFEVSVSVGKERREREPFCVSSRAACLAILPDSLAPIRTPSGTYPLVELLEPVESARLLSDAFSDALASFIGDVDPLHWVGMTSSRSEKHEYEYAGSFVPSGFIRVRVDLIFPGPFAFAESALDAAFNALLFSDGFSLSSVAVPIDYEDIYSSFSRSLSVGAVFEESLRLSRVCFPSDAPNRRRI